MSKYEFSYQSPKQKATLIAIKLIVLAMTGSMIHWLVWGPPMKFEQQIGTIGSVLTGFWMYSNLCRVKVEVQELFVEPMNITHMVEVMLIGAVFHAYKVGHDVWFIIDDLFL